MVADGPADDHHVARLGALGPDVDPVGEDPDPGRVDVDAVAVTAIDHLRVPRDQFHAGAGRSGGHRLDDHPELGHREALFEDEAGADEPGLGAAHRHVVHRPVDRQFADVPSGKEPWPYDEGVRREGDAARTDLQDGGISQFGEFFAPEGGDEEVVDELGRELPASAVPQHDVGVVPQRHRARPRIDGGGHGEASSSSLNRPYR